MHVFEFIILVVIVAGVFEFLKQRQKLQSSNQTNSKQHTELETEVEQLRDRVATLEKIVTAKGYDLKQQIDDL